MSEKIKRPRDTNLLSKFIVDTAIGRPQSIPKEKHPKNPHAAALGKLGGMKGGKKRAEGLSPQRRSEIARKAAKKRWESSNKS